MPEITAKSYNQKVQMIEKMIEGIKQHQNDEDFPAMLNVQAIEKLRDGYTASRSQMDEHASLFRQSTQKFKQDDKTFDKTISQLKTMVYGMFGKKNAAVRDFGLLPFKDKPKGKKAQSK
jgi:hypothetical protein